MRMCSCREQAGGGAGRQKSSIPADPIRSPRELFLAWHGTSHGAGMRVLPAMQGWAVIRRHSSALPPHGSQVSLQTEWLQEASPDPRPLLQSPPSGLGDRQG